MFEYVIIRKPPKKMVWSNDVNLYLGVKLGGEQRPFKQAMLVWNQVQQNLSLSKLNEHETIPFAMFVSYDF